VSAEICIAVPGRPRAAPRPRGGRHGFYMPASMREYHAVIQAAWRAEDPPDWPLDRRYWVEIFLVPPSEASMGDVDNYAKNYLDALNGIAWKDDKQVDRLTVERCAPNADAPCAIVRVRTIGTEVAK
jgi:crossover junction endodeoxyribonuclease RusA